MAECERCKQTGRQFNAMVRDVKALAGAWNTTRARLVAEVERLGRLEAALADDDLAYNAAIEAGSEDGCAVEEYREALQAAMQAGSDSGKEADDGQVGRC